jgi:precorrin-2 dehydrogenase/sirohydrochlorin ferrochelatase
LSYFPAFIKLENKKILIIGGGKIANEKLEKLLDFSNEITLISKQFNQDILQLIKQNNLTYIKEEYKKGFIKDFDIVIVAVDDISLQKEIYEESKNYKLLFNAVDLPKYCDFIFPSYIKKGDLTISISTSGASPAMAKRLRTYIEKSIPSSIESFLKEMRGLRKTMPKGKERMKFFEDKSDRFMEKYFK